MSMRCVSISLYAFGVFLVCLLRVRKGFPNVVKFINSGPSLAATSSSFLLCTCFSRVILCMLYACLQYVLALLVHSPQNSLSIHLKFLQFKFVLNKNNIVISTYLPSCELR